MPKALDVVISPQSLVWGYLHNQDNVYVLYRVIVYIVRGDVLYTAQNYGVMYFLDQRCNSASIHLMLISSN
jgi:hypothetical protein